MVEVIRIQDEAQDVVKVILHEPPSLVFTPDEAHALASKLADLLDYDLEKRTHEDKYSE